MKTIKNSITNFGILLNKEIINKIFSNEKVLFLNSSSKYSDVLRIFVSLSEEKV